MFLERAISDFSYPKNAERLREKREKSISFVIFQKWIVK